MKYLLLSCHDEARWRALVAKDREALERSRQPYDADLRAGAHVIATGDLARGSYSISPPERNGHPTPTDEPFPRHGEGISGFVVIEARDLNEAIRIASRHPAAHLGDHVGWRVEIRPLEHFGATT